MLNGVFPFISRSFASLIKQPCSAAERNELASTSIHSFSLDETGAVLIGEEALFTAR